MKKFIKILASALVFVAAFGLIGARFRSSTTNNMDLLLLADALPRSFDIHVSCVGTLEASRSTVIASSIKGDIGKIVYLIPEGARVNAQDVLIKMDPTPFEEAIATLQEKVRTKENALDSIQKNLEWEKEQVQHEIKAADYEIETAELELNKIVNGDGPQEIAKLQGTFEKERAKYEELEGYMHDLALLEQDGYLNPSEIKQAERQFSEAKLSYENAKMQHDSYVNFVHPMQVKKAETALKRTINKKEECIKSGEFRIAKERSQLTLAQQELNDLKNGLKFAKNELVNSEIYAPTPGMVVHKEEFRAGQRRKPRVGDTLIRNQPILDLPDLDKMNVKTKVRELDLCKVQVGHPVTVKVDAYPNLLLSGHVKSIGVLAFLDGSMGDEKSFEVIVALDQSDANLRPGMTSRLVIHSASIKDSLCVPVHAIFEYAKQPYCYVMQSGRFAVKPISIGQSNEEWVEVTGLESGEQVSLTQPSNEQIHDPEGFLGKKT